MKSRILGLLAVGLLAGSATNMASAATIVGTCGPATGTDVGIVEVFAECGAFDSNLGTLTGISYSLSGRLFGSFVIVNAGDAAGVRTAGKATLEVMFIQSELGELLLDTFEQVAVPEATLQPNESVTVPYDRTVMASGAIAPLLFNDFIAPFPVVVQLIVGVQDFPPDIGQCNFPTPVGACIVLEDPRVSAELSGTFTYTYNPVVVPVPTPEPGTLALVGLGLAGLGLRRRRKAT